MKDEKAKLIDFFFELGMLKRTPRSGFNFLGTGNETVAEHSFRTAWIGYALAKLDDKADPLKTMYLCLAHDLPEARTGDANYVNKQYVKIDEESAISDICDNVFFKEELFGVMNEFIERKSIESVLAHDADQLDFILTLKHEFDHGNTSAHDWIEHVEKRLVSDIARELAAKIMKADSSDWWYRGNGHWWA